VAHALFKACTVPYLCSSQAMKRRRSASEYDTMPLPLSLLKPLANSAGCLA